MTTKSCSASRIWQPRRLTLEKGVTTMTFPSFLISVLHPDRRRSVHNEPRSQSRGWRSDALRILRLITNLMTRTYRDRFGSWRALSECLFAVQCPLPVCQMPDNWANSIINSVLHLSHRLSAWDISPKYQEIPECDKETCWSPTIVFDWGVDVIAAGVKRATSHVVGSHAVTNSERIYSLIYIFELAGLEWTGVWFLFRSWIAFIAIHIHKTATYYYCHRIFSCTHWSIRRALIKDGQHELVNHEFYRCHQITFRWDTRCYVKAYSMHHFRAIKDRTI